MGEREPVGEGPTLHRLTATSRALSDKSTVAEMLRITVETAESLLGADKVVLLLQDDEGRVGIRAARGVSIEAASRFDASFDESLFSRLGTLLGADLPTSFVGMPLLARGEVRGLLVVLLDKAKRSERNEWVLSALADQASAALEHGLQEATNEDLASRLAELHTKGRRQEQALQVVRHDLGTPIGAIRGYLNLLERDVYGPLTPRQRTALQRIDIAVLHLEALVEEALEMSRLYSGEVTVACQPVVVRRVIEEALGMIELPAREARVRLRADVPADLSILCDAGRLRQVLVHLLDNAIKHGGTGGEVLVLGARDDPPETATLRICDEGPGISPEMAHEMFEPYKKFGDRGGSGLGLAIARAVTELMGGQIGVEASVPKGATFYVRLPCAQQP